MSKRLARFVVEFELPAGATKTDAREYVDDAVCSMRGALRPAGAYGDDDLGDAMFYLDTTTVRVTFFRKRSK